MLPGIRRRARTLTLPGMAFQLEERACAPPHRDRVNDGAHVQRAQRVKGRLIRAETRTWRRGDPMRSPRQWASRGAGPHMPLRPRLHRKGAKDPMSSGTASVPLDDHPAPLLPGRTVSPATLGRAAGRCATTYPRCQRAAPARPWCAGPRPPRKAGVDKNIIRTSVMACQGHLSGVSNGTLPKWLAVVPQKLRKPTGALGARLLPAISQVTLTRHA